jgi:hypothetical protein
VLKAISEQTKLVFQSTLGYCVCMEQQFELCLKHPVQLQGNCVLILCLWPHEPHVAILKPHALTSQSSINPEFILPALSIELELSAGVS